MLTAAQVLKRYGIGLTGGIGTGKSTVGRILATLGCPVIDADQLARQVTAAGEPALAEIARAFGAEMLTAQGELDRPKLGQRIFADPALRQRLEAITHPRIRQALAAKVESLGLLAAPRTLIYEASLIFETGIEDHFAVVWATFCPEALQLQRVMARDGVDEQRARQVLASQMPAKAKADRAKHTFATDQPLAAVEAAVRAALAQFDSGH